MATPAESALIVAHLAAGFPDVQVTEATVAAYAEDLADLPGEQVWQAARELRRTARFFPRISEIRERAEDLHTRAIEAARTRVHLLETGRADPSDPRYIEAQSALKAICGGIGKPMPGGAA